MFFLTLIHLIVFYRKFYQFRRKKLYKILFTNQKIKTKFIKGKHLNVYILHISDTLIT